jgi:glycosyltransferase involved in cell wall biosynthesis
MTKIRVHATNVSGTGAIQLFNSLFPELVGMSDVLRAYVSPEIEATAIEALTGNGNRVRRIDRRLPAALSRVLECTVLAKRFRGEGAILVLGDIPLFGGRRQVVLVHSPNLLKSATRFQRSEWKYLVSRALFAFNQRYVAAFVVQSQVMRDGLVAAFPAVRDRVHIIPQPPPRWVLSEEIVSPRENQGDGLRLFYPANVYPHKNHGLLRHLDADDALKSTLSKITLTISQDEAEGVQSEVVNCVGRLSEAEIIQQYRLADALLFLSKKETFGFPLVEAMWLKLPIICPDLPYARWMCGNEAVYFDPDSSQSLRAAILKMHELLKDGWRPDWSEQLKKIPTSWRECAREFVHLCEIIE